MSLVITEIMGRSEQGTTRPFLCRGDDGHAYFVKGRFAGGRSLCCEWLAGRLAQLAGLPVTEARIAEVPWELIRFSSRRDARELGEGRVFASRVIDGARELTWKDVNLVPIDTRCRVLWFDGWVQNADRTLSSYGGNPNLMVSLDGERIWAFDFNLAFDEAFDTQQFWATHAFVGAATDNLPDAFLAQAAEWMREGLRRLDDFWGELPIEWLFPDGDLRQHAFLDRGVVERILGRFEGDPGRLKRGES